MDTITIEKFYLRLFHGNCCITCISLNDKTKYCSDVKIDLKRYFDNPTETVWRIGCRCPKWR